MKKYLFLLVIGLSMVLGQSQESAAQTTVTVGPGQDHENCLDAVKTLTSTGGIIEIYWKPEAYDTRCGAVGKQGHVIVRGIAGPNGELPLFRPVRHDRDGNVLFDSSGQPLRETWLSFIFPRRAPNPSATLLVENIRVERVPVGINARNFGRLVLRNFHLTDCTNNGIWISKPPPEQFDDMGNHVLDGVPYNMVFEMYGGSVTRCGGGNTRHNFYVYGDRIVLDGVTSSAANNSETFKSNGRHVEIRNSTFATTLKENFGPEEFSLASTLVVLNACGSSVIENNKFILWPVLAKDRLRGGWGSVGKHAISYRARRSIKGCDLPPYDSVVFWSDRFWSGIEVAGLLNPQNPELFHHILRGNVFEARGPNVNRAVAVEIYGTVPQEAIRQFGASRLLQRPDGWFERTRIWSSHNDLGELSVEHIYRGLIAAGEAAGLGGKGLNGLDTIFIEACN